MSLYTEARGVSPGVAARQPVVSTKVDPARFEELAALVEAALPNAVLNKAAIEKGGINAAGDPIVQYAVTQRRPMKASVTFYHNGSVTWAGIEPIELPAA